MNDPLTQMPLGIYIHVPFCVRKCFYCDFLSAPSDEQTREKYVDALCAEIRAQAPLYQNYQVKTVFFGGGTPSLLDGKQIARIMWELREAFSIPEEAEITMEANPGTLTPEKLQAYCQAGINRLSIGLQSANDEELRILGRIHTWAEFQENYAAARNAGFNNINIDLMSALPGQSRESWMETVRKVTALKPEHISAYSLIVEEGTPFYEWYGEQDTDDLTTAQGNLTACTPHPPLPDEETDRAMYAWTKEYLASQGYERYEFSNYARPGYESRHNSSYWKRIDYVGLGLGSSSLRQNVRWSNTADLREYLQFSGEEGFETRLKENISRLTVQEQMEEFMFLGLRMSEGISCGEFQSTFGVTVEQIYGDVIKKLKQEGLLVELEGDSNSGRKTDSIPDNKRLALTEYGVDVSNYALAEFLLT